MKGDTADDKLLVARGDQPREKASSTDRHATVIDLTLGTGEPLMCIIVMKGKIPHADVELGFDPFVPIQGEENDENFFEKILAQERHSQQVPLVITRGKTYLALSDGRRLDP